MKPQLMNHSSCDSCFDYIFIFIYVYFFRLIGATTAHMYPRSQMIVAFDATRKYFETSAIAGVLVACTCSLVSLYGVTRAG